MPGAWEVNPSVLVCILHVETVPMAWALGLRKLQLPQHHHIMPMTGAPYDHEGQL